MKSSQVTLIAWLASIYIQISLKHISAFSEQDDEKCYPMEE